MLKFMEKKNFDLKLTKNKWLKKWETEILKTKVAEKTQKWTACKIEIKPKINSERSSITSSDVKSRAEAHTDFSESRKSNKEIRTASGEEIIEKVLNDN